MSTCCFSVLASQSLSCINTLEKTLELITQMLGYSPPNRPPGKKERVKQPHSSRWQVWVSKNPKAVRKIDIYWIQKYELQKRLHTNKGEKNLKVKNDKRIKE